MLSVETAAALKSEADTDTGEEGRSIFFDVLEIPARAGRLRQKRKRQADSRAEIFLRLIDISVHL